MDDWDDETTPDVLPGHAAEAGGTDVAEVVLALTGEIAKLAIVLSELDESSFSAVKPRLKILRDVFAQMPQEPTRKAARVRVIGFRPSGRKRR